MYRFEFRYRIPGVGYAGEVVLAICAAAAQALIEAKYPGAEVSWVKQLD